MSNQEEYILSQVIQKHNIKVDKINNGKSKVKSVEHQQNAYLNNQKENGNKIVCLQKLKSHSNEGKGSQKCVRIAPASSKNVQNKNPIHAEYQTTAQLNVCSMKGLDDINECSIEQIEMNVSENEVLQAKTVNLQKPSNKKIMKNSTGKIKSNHEIGAEGNYKSQKSMNKSSKSIKFNDKKDIFTYKQEREKGKQSKSKKKIKLQNSKQNILEQKQLQECCTIM